MIDICWVISLVSLSTAGGVYWWARASQEASNRKIKALREALLREQDRRIARFPDSITPEVIRQTEELVAQAERLGAGGEYKRFQFVYGKLQNLFPAIPRKDLGFIIEVCKQWHK